MAVSRPSPSVGPGLFSPPATYAQRVGFCLLLNWQRIFFGFSIALQLANVALLSAIIFAGNEVLPVPTILFAVATPLSLLCFAIGVAPFCHRRAAAPWLIRASLTVASELDRIVLHGRISDRAKLERFVLPITVGEVVFLFRNIRSSRRTMVASHET